MDKLVLTLYAAPTTNIEKNMIKYYDMITNSKTGVLTAHWIPKTNKQAIAIRNYSNSLINENLPIFLQNAYVNILSFKDPNPAYKALRLDISSTSIILDIQEDKKRLFIFDQFGNPSFYQQEKYDVDIISNIGKINSKPYLDYLFKNFE
ncbi:MAG: hypothetical protein ACMXX6_00720 [Candidatus Woesearchaeota archaeon]